MSQYQSRSIIIVAKCIGFLPVSAREKTKRAGKREEDDDEDNVGAQGADEVDEAEDAHEDEEEGEGGCETDGGEASAFGVGGCGCVGAVGEVRGCEGCGKREPECAKGDEDYEGKCIAEDEFEEPADSHKETTEEVVGTTMKDVSDTFTSIRG